MLDIVDPFKPAAPVAPSSGINDPFATLPAAPSKTDALAAFDASRPKPAASAPGYSLTDIPKEVLSGALQGTGAAVSGIGSLGQLIARPIVAGVNTAAGGEVLPAPKNAFEPIGEGIAGLGQRVAASESAGAQAAKEKPIVTGDISDLSSIHLGEGAKSPMALALGAAGLAGQAVPLLAGGLEGRVAKLAPEIAERVPAVMAKLASGEALTGGETAVAQAATDAAKTAARRSIATGAGIGGVQGAQSSADAERARIEQMPASDLAALPGYQSRITSGMTPDQARADLADKSAQNTFAATLPASTAMGIASVAPLLHETQGVLSRIAGKSVAQRALVGAAAEAPIQAGLAVAQGASGIAGANVETGENRSLTEGSAAQAATGGLLGAGFGAFGGIASTPHVEPKARARETVTAPGETSTAQPETGAPAAAPTGPLSEAATELPAIPPGGMPLIKGEGRAPAEPMQPPAAPWINAETGEITKPTDNQVKDQFHKLFDAASASGAGARATAASRMLAEEWQVPRDRLIALRKDALAERNAGLKTGDTRPGAEAESGDLTPPSGELFPETLAEATPRTQGEDHAVEAGGQPGSRELEHPQGDQTGQAAEAGGSDRAGRSASDEHAPAEETKPEAVAAKESTTHETASEETASAQAAKPADGEAVSSEAGNVPAARESVPPEGGEVREGNDAGAGSARAPDETAPSSAKEGAAEAVTERPKGAPLPDTTPVDTKASVPYAGGVSDDGKTVFIDRSLPKTVDVDGKTVDVHDVTAYHERVEWPLMHELGKSYEEAHRIATASEGKYVADKYGVDPSKYQSVVKDAVAAARSKADIANVPKNLDTKPYVDSGEEHLVKPATAEAAAPAVEAAASEAAAHPNNEGSTAAQQEANNAKAGHVDLHGLDVTIQVPKGGLRKGIDAQGKPWERAASDHYGHIRGTESSDGEQHDVYLGPHADDQNAKVFVIDQVKPGTKVFDEHKSMIGYTNGKAARASYQKNFPKGMDTFGGIKEMPIVEFKKWVKSEAAKQPVTDQVRVGKELPPIVRGKRESSTLLRERAKEAAKKLAEPKVMDFEQYAAARGASRQDIGDAGMHSPRGHVSKAANRAADRVEEKRNAQLIAKRAALHVEYGEAVARGEIRPPTSKERLEATAAGHPDNPSVQAAQRALARREEAKRASAPPGKTVHEKTGLFRQGGEDKTAKFSELRSRISEVTSKWGENAPRVRVIDSPEQLPARAKENAGYRDAQGWYDGETAYIVAKNQKSVEDALSTLAHEVIGHHGIYSIINDHVPGGWDKLSADIDRLRTKELGSTAMQSVLRAVARRYPGADKDTFARETLAVMAERGIKNGIIGRAVAAVRAFLRKIMPGLNFNESDLRGMLGHSEAYIKAGRSLEQRQAMVRAMSFDQPETAGLTPGEKRNPAVVADASRAWQEEGTKSPYFQKFFEGSKVEKGGNPTIVYHGTASDHTVFKDTALGDATGHSTSPLGHFFTENKALAERYAENASEGVPADQRVVDAYLAIKKPFEMTLDHAQAIESQAEARALKAKLMKEGYDGIHVAEAKSWVAFDSNQIKSTENRGTFDPTHGDINFSMPEASMDTLGEVLAKPDETAFDRAKAWLRGKAEDLRPAALGALQTRHVLELMENHPALKGAKQYGEQMQRLASDRQQLMAGAPDAAEHPKDMLKRGGANIAADLNAFTRKKGPGGWFGAKTEEGKRLADVMHSATIYGLDPSKEYQRLTIEDSRGGAAEWTPAGIKERIKELRGQMRGRPGDDKSMMMEEVKRLRNIPRRENLRTQRWPELVAKYQALPEEGKRLFQQQRDWHSQMSDETEKGIIARIEALGHDIGKNYVRSLQDRIRLQFETQRNEGVYFPLNRDGDYWTSFTDKDGRQGFKMFETAKDAIQAEKKLREAGFKIDAQGRRDTAYKAKDAPSGTFVKDVVQLLAKAGASDKVQDDVYQMFLKTLPEMSMRKHAIHRQNVPGFSEDITRAFAKNSFHGAHQLARLRHAYEMQSTIEAMQSSLDNYRRGEFGESSKSNTLDVARGDALLQELKKRHDYIMAPKDTQLSNVANSIGFLYYLGASPASAIVNLTQNAQVTLPVLGAHHGWDKASAELGKAMKDSLRTFGNIDRTLTDPQEREAYNVMRTRGDIDKTQSHTLAGLAEGSLLSTNPVWAKAMSGMTYMFHKAEVINREAAGIAAFRLATKRGDNFHDAVQYASDIINGTHFDYSAANRPRLMQGNAARVALQFKNYSLGMTWAVYRNLYQAFKGETPEIRRIALKTLTGIMGTTAIMAGSMGLPMYNALKYAGNAAHALWGDDEPWDFDTEYRGWLADHLGQDAAKWVADGAVNRLGAQVGTRVSLSDLWFQNADKELEGKDQYYAYLEALAGPLGGMAKNFFVGSKMVGDGNVERGIETMMPKFAKDAMKATRFAYDGANTLRGDPILPDVTGPEAFIQSIGFQPTRLFEQQQTNNALKNYEQEILDRRQTLMNAYAMAVRSGDDKDTALAKIHAFNEQYPEIALKADAIRQSLRARAKYSAQSESGIFLNKKIASRVREDVGTQPATPQ